MYQTGCCAVMNVHISISGLLLRPDLCQTAWILNPVGRKLHHPHGLHSPRQRKNRDQQPSCELMYDNSSLAVYIFKPFYTLHSSLSYPSLHRRPPMMAIINTSDTTTLVVPYIHELLRRKLPSSVTHVDIVVRQPQKPSSIPCST